MTRTKHLRRAMLHRLYVAAAPFLRYPMQQVNGWCMPTVARGDWTVAPPAPPRPPREAGLSAWQRWDFERQAAGRRVVPNRVRLRWDAHVEFDRGEFERRVCERTGAWWGFAYLADLGVIELTFVSPPNELPIDDHHDGRCRMPYQALSHDGFLVVGLDANGGPVGMPTRRLPHGIVAGTSLGGKTTTASSLILGAHFDPGWRVDIGDPKVNDLEPFAESPIVLSYEQEPDEILARVSDVLEEMQDRKARVRRRNPRRQGPVESLADVIAAEGRRLLALDEWTSLMTGATKGERALAAELQAKVGKLTQQGGGLGFHVLLIGQAVGYNELPTWAKVNCEWRVVIGRTTPAGSDVMLEDQAGALLPRGVAGRMAVRGMGNAVTIAQGFHVTAETVTRELARWAAGVTPAEGAPARTVAELAPPPPPTGAELDTTDEEVLL